MRFQTWTCDHRWIPVKCPAAQLSLMTELIIKTGRIHRRWTKSWVRSGSPCSTLAAEMIAVCTSPFQRRVSSLWQLCSWDTQRQPGVVQWFGSKVGKEIITEIAGSRCQWPLAAAAKQATMFVWWTQIIAARTSLHWGPEAGLTIIVGRDEWCGRWTNNNVCN